MILIVLHVIKILLTICITIINAARPDERAEAAGRGAPRTGYYETDDPRTTTTTRNRAAQTGNYEIGLLERNYYSKEEIHPTTDRLPTKHLFVLCAGFTLKTNACVLTWGLRVFLRSTCLFMRGFYFGDPRFKSIINSCY